MKSNRIYMTMVPGRRISFRAKPEMRISVPLNGEAKITANFNNEEILLGNFVLGGDYSLNRIFLDVSALRGGITLNLHYISGDKSAKNVISEKYFVVDSDTVSTQLIDGCWISLYHWSEDEARWFNKDLAKLSDDDWKQKIYDMHSVGITSVLIQNVVYCNEYVCQHSMTAKTHTGSAMYPSALIKERYPLAASDPIEAILTAADECNMTVFPGVGMYAWFDFSAESLQWHIELTKELNDMYGHHKSFYGWYISEEIMGALYYGYPPVPDEKYKDIQIFFKEYKKFIQQLTPTKPIALAPNNIDFHIYEEEWLPILENLDIIIPFAFARYEEKYNVKEIAEICKKTDTHFWVDMEMFKFPLDNGLVPKSYEELIEEIRSYDVLEQIYGYQYTGIMNSPTFLPRLGREDTVELFGKYIEYSKGRLSENYE